MADNLSNDTANENEGFVNHPHVADVAADSVAAEADFNQLALNPARPTWQRALDYVSQAPAGTRELAARLKTDAEARPWLHIAVAGAGALAIGYLLGRLISSPQRLSAEMGRGYGDFDEADAAIDQ